MQVALKPYLMYVPGHAGNNPHFRGGDDLIIPINRVEDMPLMDALMAVLSVHPNGISKESLLAHETLAASAKEIDVLLAVMLESGVIWQPPEAGPQDFLWNYLSRFATSMSDIEQRVSSAKMSIRSFVNEGNERVLRKGFEACRLDLDCDDTTAELTIVLADFLADDSLDALNAEMLKQERSWMLLRLAGPAQLQLGPVFIPGETACYQCLSRRMEANRRYFSAYQDLKEAKEPVAPHGNWHPLHLSMAGQAAAFECVKFILGLESSPLVGAMRTIDFLTGETEQETLLRLPDCASCGRSDGD